MIPNNPPWTAAFKDFNSSLNKCQAAFANERLELARTMQQRDELLAALKALMEEAEKISPDWNVFDAAEAIVAKVESGVTG